MHFNQYDVKYKSFEALEIDLKMFNEDISKESQNNMYERKSSR